MREVEYSEAAIEVLDILNYTNKEDVARIPKSFIKFLTDISSKSYKVKFNHEQPIKGLNLRKQTRELLGFIYITWWCNKEEREKYKSLIQNKKIKKEEVLWHYDVNDIFKNKNLPHQHNQRLWEDTQKTCCLNNKNKEYSMKNEYIEQTSIATYKKDNLIKKLLSKILSFFKLKKEGR